MKIQIVGSENIVDSVNAEVDTATNQLHICITTRERWVPHQLSGGWGMFSAQCVANAPPPAHRLIAVGPNEVADPPGAEVVFLPETEVERDMLFGVAYHHAEKEQICYVMLPVAIPRARTMQTLAEWPAR